MVLDGDCWNVHETCSRKKRAQGNTFSVVQGRLSRARCSSAVQDALGVVQDTLSVVQDTLDVVQDALSREDTF